MNTPVQPDTGRNAHATALLYGVVGLLLAGLLVYSQIQAFSWDEGFHLLAARLILEGQLPYLDFCFPQTPLNAYWYAGWMQVFGGGWRTTHVVASLLTAGAILLAADFVLRRLPVREWRLAGAAAAALLIGFNAPVIEFGTIAQAYALCLFLTVAAFRLATAAVSRNGPWLAALAGLLASAAAASSLLTALATPVLLAWIFVYNRNGSRWTKLGGFLAAAVVPFLPVLWLLSQSPHQVWFNLAGYQLLYRRSDWEGATSHDLDVLTSWIDSGPALLLGLLAVTGLLFIAKRSGWERVQRSEFYLCAWLAGAMSVEIATAHPTFTWYFLFVIPFLAILAVPGLYEVGSRMYKPDRPMWPVVLLTILLAVSLVRALREDRESMTWGEMQALANKVVEVTPPEATLWAGEQIYFLTRRPPPDGMEFAAAHKLDMPIQDAASLHILPKKELDQRVKAGTYSTIAICDDDRIKELELPQLYAKKAEVSNCTVFWDKLPRQVP